MWYSNKDGLGSRKQREIELKVGTEEFFIPLLLVFSKSQPILQLKVYSKKGHFHDIMFSSMGKDLKKKLSLVPSSHTWSLEGFKIL